MAYSVLLKRFARINRPSFWWFSACIKRMVFERYYLYFVV